ncbi:MAG: Mur ligase family protein [Cyanobacteria bacterium P01_H01_bin.15]
MQLGDRIRLSLAVATAKLVTAGVRFFKLGAASVLPGQIARQLHPRLLSLLCEQIHDGVILVVGTNGKTTTSLLLREMLEKNGAKVAHNATGANLLNGLVAALLANADFVGNLNVDYAILEVDENVLPLVLKECEPRFILALNLFRDQLDRYGEVDTIAKRWQDAIAYSPKTTVVLNADDPTLSYLGQNIEQKSVFFGLNESELYLDEIPHAVDSIYCPSCGSLLDYEGVYLSHLGEFQCGSCGFKKGKTSLDSPEWPQVLIGVYNKYNTLAAATVAQEIGLSDTKILEAIAGFKAAFGRAEELTVEGKHVRILLSKNPVGTNETIRAVNQIKKAGKASTTLFVLNDRIPDGTDVSWIWDVDLEDLAGAGGTVIVSGDRVFDMALRFKYGRPENSPELELLVEEDLNKAVQLALAKTPTDETLHILPTYSAMLEVRQQLTGRGIL